MGVMTPQLNKKPVNEHTKDELHNSKDDYRLKIINIVALCMFAITISGWIMMNCIYLRRGIIFHSVMQDEFFINIRNINNQTVATLPIILQNDVGLVIWLVLSGTTTFLFLLKTLNYLPKFWVVIGVIVDAVIFILSLFCIFWSIYVFLFFQNAPSLSCFLLVIIVMCRLIISSIPTKNLDLLIESLKKTSRVSFSFPSVFLFGFTTAMLIITVTAFTAVSVYSMDSIASSIISLLGGIYLVSVIFHFVSDVTDECINILNYSQNKEAKSGCTLLKSIGVVVRRESGFIILWCTIIVPLILALFLCYSKKLRQYSHPHVKAHLVQSWLICNGLDYVLSSTASHPTVAYEAMKTLFDLIFMRSYAISCTIATVFANILVLFSAIGMIVSVGVPFTIFQNSLVGTKTFIQIAVIYSGLGIALLFGVAFATLNVAASVTEYNVQKETVKSVKREMPHSEDKTSKNCAIDQIQEPCTITDV